MDEGNLCPVAELDRQSGERPSGSGIKSVGPRTDNAIFGNGLGASDHADIGGDTGGASRFFYVAKASRAERNTGLEGFEERQAQKWNEGGIKARRAETAVPVANVHPTVKPVDLMRWLIRLVTPPDGTVLDPFAGSGTTGIACVLEDFDFIGIERESDYAEIARARIDYWARQPKQLGLLDVA